MSDDSDKRHRKVADMLPADWDRNPYGIAGELRAFLSTIKDEGSAIDSGSGDGSADLWVKVEGVEYFVSIRRSNAQLKREGRLTHPTLEG